MTSGADIFKNKEELADFLENLGIEYRYACYSDRSAEGCTLLGDYLQLIKKDFKKAVKVYKYGCEEFSYGKACNKYGVELFMGRGVKKDIASAFAQFKKACENDSAEGCFHAGQILTGGDTTAIKAGIKPDPGTAIKMLEKGCELDCYESCFHAHSILYSGMHGVAIDKEKSFNCAKKACESIDHLESCNNLKLMYERGEGCPKDKQKVKEVQERINDILAVIEKQRGLDLQDGATEA